MKKLLKNTVIATTIAALGTVIWTSEASINSVKTNSDEFDFSLLMPDDTIDDNGNDTIDLPYPFEDYSGNPYSSDYEQDNGLFLGQPSNVRNSVRYDPATNSYIFSDSIGGFQYRPTRTMSFDEYREYEFQQSVQRYWRQRVAGDNAGGGGSLLHPQLSVNNDAFEKIFGSNTIDIKPSGTAELTFGINISNIENPNLPKKLQRSVTFDFDEKIQMGVQGQIGDKMRLGINYNTEATFDFENEMKLSYEGDEDEIIQLIEAGNVSLPLTGSLITGSQSLFGFKTELQFGKLSVTSIFSQQKGESSVIEIEGGAQVKEFEISGDEYEANRHFFLTQFFRDSYEGSMSNLPVIQSGITITKAEVWITNTTGQYEESRNILGVMDLAEGYDSIGDPNYYAPTALIEPNTGQPYPVADRSDNPQTNQLYDKLLALGNGVRDINNITSTLNGQFGNDFVGGRDYEKVENARLLSPSEYTLHPKLGYISLKQALNADEVLAVAFEYTIAGGGVFQVGEFSNGAVSAPNTLIVKLLKGTNLTPSLPTWDLMMKNIYSIGAYQVSSEDFRLNIKYADDKTGNDLEYFKGGEIYQNTQYIQLLNLDNLNSQGQPGSDGRFDFIEGITIVSNNGRVIIPVLEPFGDYLRRQINDDAIADQYVFEELYDSTQSKAKQMASKNKFKLQGEYQSSSGSEIFLNAMNIPQGSVKVTSGGMTLTEGTDYIVDYTLGRVTILNHGLLESGQPIQISLESNALFNIGTKTLMGTHLDYRFSENFTLSGSILNLNERPLTNKVSIGNEAMSNTIWGVNGTYNTEVPLFTKWVDWLPLIETKAPSQITVEGEFAQLVPGTSRSFDNTNVSYIDDFEGSQTSIDIKMPTAWVLASAPQGQPLNFPEADLTDNVAYGFNRAKLAWYNVNSDFVRKNSSAAPGHLSSDDKSNHLVREVLETDIFPKKESETGFPQSLTVLNLAFYPDEKGPYNYDIDPNEYSAGINADGTLREPQTRWGGIMREIQTNDFEAANIEYIEFWLMDPFVYDENNEGVGQEARLYFNLGNISEDILKDSRKSFEHGLPVTEEIVQVDSTVWGHVPLLQSLTRAFDNDPTSREYQDVGFDGLSDDNERTFFSGANPLPTSYPYLDLLASSFGQASEAYQNAMEDPSNDNYHYFKGGDYDAQELSILERYKRFNGMENNSPTDEQNPEDFPTSGSLLPDIEDINQDNTLSENESYYQYSISLRPEDMTVGQNYITDMVIDENERVNGETNAVTWYQFKIPVFDPESTIGSIDDFKSIRFMRMFLRGVSEDLVLRFAKLELVRGEWRKYNLSLLEGGESGGWGQTNDDVGFDISSVNIEENANRTPVNYVLPPGVDRVTDPMNPQLRKLNEQAIVLKVNNLGDGDARAAYKNVNMDIRQYGRIRMDAHAEKLVDDVTSLEDGDLVAFIRVGTDYTENYYEYQVPLTLTPHGTYSDNVSSDREIVWPAENEFDIDLDVFLSAKQQRNDAMRVLGSNVDPTKPFTIIDGENTVVVVGSPNLSKVRTIMIGVYNPSDNGMAKSGEIWLNELRLTDFNDKGGWAANARVRADFADFITLNVSGSTSKPGFGSIEKKVSERDQEEVYMYDISGTAYLGKLFPQRYEVQIPMYVGYSETFVNPEYNPLDPDIPLDVALNNPELSESERDSIRHIAQDYTRRKSINFTNVKINNPRGRGAGAGAVGRGGAPPPPGGGPNRGAKRPFYSIANFSTTYSFREEFHRNINTEYDLFREHYGALNYNYTNRPKNITPFSGIGFLRKPAFQFIRDANFYYAPSQISVRTEMNKRYQERQLRDLENPDNFIEPEFPKEFSWNRYYDIKYNLTRGLKLDFSASNMALVYEPDGKLDPGVDDYQQRRDSIWQSVLNFGETTNYTHRFDVTYNVPINKLPGLRWVNMTTKYTANYYWDRGLQTGHREYELGHTIRNDNNKNASLQFNLKSLYNKADFLKKNIQNYTIGDNKPPPRDYEDVVFEKIMDIEEGANVISHRLGTEDEIVLEIVDAGGATIPGEMEVLNDNRIKFISPNDYEGARVKVTGRKMDKPNVLRDIAGYTTNLLMSLKTISVTYTENSGTILPGYMERPRIMGLDQDGDAFAPGIPFVLGFQDRDFAYDAGNRYNWLSTDSLLNTPYVMNKTTQFDVRATLEPVSGFKIDLTMNRSFAENVNEYYYYDPGFGFFAENQQIGGNFRMTFNSIRTAFVKMEGEYYESQTFEDFKTYRTIIGQRLAQERAMADLPPGISYDPALPNMDMDGNPVDGGGQSGYPNTSQEVILPAFLAAYSGREPEDITLDPFPTIPNINWRVMYDGLGKLEWMQQYFKSINISHSYVSTYNVGNYINSPRYDFDQQDNYGYSWVVDELNRFIPEQEINMVSISEQFSPMLGVDMTWNNSLNTKIEYTRKRDLQMSFSNNQLAEALTNGWIVGIGYRLKELPVQVGRNKFESDLDLRGDLRIENSIQVLRKLDEESNQPTAGFRRISFNLSADYVLNERFNLRFFIDRVVNKPVIAQSFPNANTKIGFTIRFTLIP